MGTIHYRNELGQRHREDGPAIEDPNGSKEWWVHGKRHRLDGPAIERANGSKEWFVNDMRHRLDGPAGILADGFVSYNIFGWGIGNSDGVGSKLIRAHVTRLCKLNLFLKLTVLQNKSRKFNEWLFDPDHYAGRWHKKNMLRDFQDS